MAFVTKLTRGFLTFSNIVNKELLLVENTPGVPQGTVLGPLRFLTYVSDLPNNIHSSIRLFADDCVLYREIKNEIDSQELQRLKFTNEMGLWLANAFQSSNMFCNETNTR